MADTWLNGFFFEYDDPGKNLGSVKGIQYKIVTDLLVEPVSLEFFKQHARIDFEMDDNLATSYIKAARQELEKYSQLSFGDRNMKLLAKELPKEFRLMYGPVLEITAPVDTYTLLGDIITSVDIQTNVTIEYTVSWGAVGLPESIKIAIAQTAAGLYASRENVLTEIAFGTLMNQSKTTLNQFKNAYFL
jgi:hypothetical protein